MVGWEVPGDQWRSKTSPKSQSCSTVRIGNHRRPVLGWQKTGCLGNQQNKKQGLPKHPVSFKGVLQRLEAAI